MDAGPPSNRPGWWTARDPAWDRGDSGLAMLLTAAFAARWSDRARSLLSWDANTFAIALEDYDVHALHPHAPGYPVYVALAKLVRFAVGDANDTLVAVSLLLTTVAALAAYRLGSILGGRAVGLATAILLAAGPVAYVHSVTANAYAAELAFGLLAALAAWRVHHDPRPRRLVVLAVVLGLAFGVRPSLAIYLGPLAAWAALRPPWDLRTQARRLGPAFAAGILTCVAWFIPMVVLSGGYSPWSEANRLQSSQVVFAQTLFTHGWPAVRDNLERIALFLRWELRFVLPVVAGLAAFAALAGLPRAGGERWGRPSTFLALWLLPPLLFFATVYSGYNEGPSGYILAVLPGLLLAGGLVGRAALSGLVSARPQAAAVLAALALVVPVLGLAAHAHDVADVGYREHDAWAEQWSHLPEGFPPDESIIVALWNFAYVWQNFPDYTSYNYRPPGQGPGEFPPVLLIQEAKDHDATPDWYDAVQAHDAALRHPLPNGTRHLVLFDFQLAGENGGPRRVYTEIPVREAFLPTGWRVLVVDVTADKPDLEDYFSPAPEGVALPDPVVVQAPDPRS